MQDLRLYQARMDSQVVEVQAAARQAEAETKALEARYQQLLQGTQQVGRWGWMRGDVGWAE